MHFSVLIRISVVQLPCFIWKMFSSTDLARRLLHFCPPQPALSVTLPPLFATLFSFSWHLSLPLSFYYHHLAC